MYYKQHLLHISGHRRVWYGFRDMLANMLVKHTAVSVLCIENEEVESVSEEEE